MAEIFIVPEGEEQICEHETHPTGERDERDRVVTACIYCGKEFVQIHAGKKRED